MWSPKNAGSFTVAPCGRVIEALIEFVEVGVSPPSRSRRDQKISCRRQHKSAGTARASIARPAGSGTAVRTVTILVVLIVTPSAPVTKAVRAWTSPADSAAGKIAVLDG